MDSGTWISLQDDDIQMEFWKRLSHFLNDRELTYVMGELERGISLIESHRRMGILKKYQLEVLKLIQTISRLYPDRTINPLL